VFGNTYLGGIASTFSIDASDPIEQRRLEAERQAQRQREFLAQQQEADRLAALARLPRVEFDSFTVTHNVDFNGQRGMLINVPTSLYNIYSNTVGFFVRVSVQGLGLVGNVQAGMTFPGRGAESVNGQPIRRVDTLFVPYESITTPPGTYEPMLWLDLLDVVTGQSFGRSLGLTFRLSR
jgi:hypothetical protein